MTIGHIYKKNISVKIGQTYTKGEVVRQILRTNVDGVYWRCPVKKIKILSTWTAWGQWAENAELQESVG